MVFARNPKAQVMCRLFSVGLIIDLVCVHYYCYLLINSSLCVHQHNNSGWIHCVPNPVIRLVVRREVATNVLKPNFSRLASRAMHLRVDEPQ